MRAAIAVAVLGILVAAGPRDAAADERRPVISVSGGVGVGASSLDDEQIMPRGLALVRFTAADALAPPSMPAARGYRWRGGLSPELTAMMVDDGERRARMLLGGARLEAAFSQREMGLLRVSARGGVWLSARAGVRRTDDGNQPAGELTVGWHLFLGRSSLMIGGDVGLLSWLERERRPAAGGVMADSIPPAVIEYGGFHALQVGLFVGAQL
jgi:hypothetical protein